MQSITVEQALARALQEHQAGRLDQAESIYRQILQVNPDLPPALHLLGVLAHQSGHHQTAIELIDRAITLNPTAADYHSNRAAVLRAMGRLDEAIASLNIALQLKPDYVDAHFNLASLMLARGRLDAAIDGFRLVLKLQPDSARAYTQLADALWEKGQTLEAVKEYRKAVHLQPGFADAHNNLGHSLERLGQLDEAMDSYQTALKIRPDWSGALYNIGNVQRDQARLDEAVESYRRAMAASPHDPVAHSNLIYSLHFHPGYDSKAIYEELLIWRKQHAEPLRQFIQSHANDRNPNRPLRVGYVSRDFRDHCQSFFTIPLLSHHDRKNFQAICYSGVARPDAITARLQSHAHEWRDIAGMSDEQVSDLIREDRIDILVDLTMHMSGNHLLVFARKPAPVQVAWLAYPGSTGLETVDNRFTDPHLDPPGINDDFYSEESIRLAESFWCYDPLTDTPEVNPLPASSAGHFTFGCLNSFAKLNDRLFGLWKQILQAVPTSRMLILAEHGSHRQRTLDLLGVDPRRIEFLSRRPRCQYLELYHRIDLALDTFPANGHTTSMDGLWMGVPVVTLPGQTAISRGGLSLLSNLGLTEFVARDEAEYVRLATAWASDIARLAELRMTLRTRMRHSTLMDAPRFSRNVESAYRAIWQRWCNR